PPTRRAAARAGRARGRSPPAASRPGRAGRRSRERRTPRRTRRAQAVAKRRTRGDGSRTLPPRTAARPLPGSSARAGEACITLSGVVSALRQPLERLGELLELDRARHRQVHAGRADPGLHARAPAPARGAARRGGAPRGGGPEPPPAHEARRELARAFGGGPRDKGA